MQGQELNSTLSARKIAKTASRAIAEGAGKGEKGQAALDAVVMRFKPEPRAGKEHSYKSSLPKGYSGGKRHKLT